MTADCITGLCSGRTIEAYGRCSTCPPQEVAATPVETLRTAAGLLRSRDEAPWHQHVADVMDSASQISRREQSLLYRSPVLAAAKSYLDLLSGTAGDVAPTPAVPRPTTAR